MKQAAIILIALILAGCDTDGGDSSMPKPRKVCTQVTGYYSCGRGGMCEQCGSWQIGCPKPLSLKQETDKLGAPELVCRLEGK